MISMFVLRSFTRTLSYLLNSHAYSLMLIDLVFLTQGAYVTKIALSWDDCNYSNMVFHWLYTCCLHCITALAVYITDQSHAIILFFPFFLIFPSDFFQALHTMARL